MSDSWSRHAPSLPSLPTSNSGTNTFKQTAFEKRQSFYWGSRLSFKKSMTEPYRVQYDGYFDGKAKIWGDGGVEAPGPQSRVWRDRSKRRGLGPRKAWDRVGQVRGVSGKWYREASIRCAVAIAWPSGLSDAASSPPPSFLNARQSCGSFKNSGELHTSLARRFMSLLVVFLSYMGNDIRREGA